MKKWLQLSVSAMFVFACCLEVQGQTSTTSLKRIDEDIKYLASDKLEGREPGSEGIEMAATYIIDAFKDAGVKSGTEDGSYRQDFKVKMGTDLDEEASKLVFTGPMDQEITAEIGSDAMVLMAGGSGETENAEIVFVGYGITAEDNNYFDYKDVDVEGKVVVMLRMEPQQQDPKSVFDGTENSEYAYITAKTANARQNKAAAIIMVNDAVSAPDEERDVLGATDEFGSTRRGAPFFHVKRSVINDLLEAAPLASPSGKEMNNLSSIEAYIDETLEPVSQSIEGWKVSVKSAFADKMISTDNIVGIVEGEGPLADETIVIGGHYDHLGFGGYGSMTPGRNEIHNGADDNATGTVGVVELARRFAQAEKKPNRRLVFIAFSGEERGLLGSAFYVNDEPLFPLEKTVAMINFDMIGQLKNSKVTIFGTGTAEEFDGMCDAANQAEEPLSLNKVPSPFAGSDHMAFVQKEIPVMFLHTGTEGGLYHTPDDDYETLNIEGAARVIDYTEKLIQQIDAAESAPKYVAMSRAPRQRPAYVGARFEYDADNNQMTVTSVNEDSPASTAGLQEGDVVTEVAGEKIGDRRSWIQFLMNNKPETEVEFKIKRGEEETTVKVKLGEPRSRRRQNTDR